MVHEKINPDEVDAKIAAYEIPPDQMSAIDSPADGEALTYNAASGKFEWKVAVGVTTLSALTIDVNKDWAGYVIKNLGAPVDAGDAYSKGNVIADADIPDVETLSYTVAFAVAQIPTISIAKISDIPGTIASILTDHNLAQHYGLFPGIDSAGKLVLTQIGTKVADLATLWTKATKIVYTDLSIANSVLFSDILSTEFNVASKFLQLDASALVPLAQIPSPLTGKDLGLVNAPASDNTGSGLITTDTVGEDVDPGEVLYMKSDGKYWLADANAVASMPAKVMAMETITTNNAGKLLHEGYFRHDAWTWALGDGQANLLFVHTTPGAMVQFANKPSGAGDQVQVLGYVVTADIVYFDPSYELVEVPT